MFELNKKNIKKILLIITYTILLCFALIKFDLVLSILGYLLNLLKPFIFGFCIAFILNIPLSRIERGFKEKKKKQKSNVAKAKQETTVKRTIKVSSKVRVFSIIFSLLIFVGIIFLTLFLVIPEFINTISIFKDSIPSAFNTVQEWARDLMSNNQQVVEKINEFKPDWQQIYDEASVWIKSMASGLIGVSIYASY